MHACLRTRACVLICLYVKLMVKLRCSWCIECSRVCAYERERDKHKEKNFFLVYRCLCVCFIAVHVISTAVV